MDAETARQLLDLMTTTFFVCFSSSILMSLTTVVGNHD